MIMRVLASTVLFVSSSAIAQTEVPNVFQPGEPARAAEVNQNFDTVEAAIDTNTGAIDANSAVISSNSSSIDENADAVAINAADISSNTALLTALSGSSGLQVFANGQPVGRLVNTPIPGTSSWLLVSDQGYVFSVPLSQRDIFFSGVDCTGQAYVEDRSISDVDPWMLQVGVVFSGPTDTFYSQRGSSSGTANYASELGSSGCFNNAGSLNLIEVFPNDVSVTGVSEQSPSGPLLFSVP